MLAVALFAQAPPAGPVARELLAAHNAVRARVGVPPLTWSSRLADVARQWAESLIATGKFSHRPKNSYGENIFEIRGGKASPSEVVGDWVSEAKDYDPAGNRCRRGAVCGHYTQVIWRDTRQVGCASARKGRREVWVCNYDPPGNWVGQRPF